MARLKKSQQSQKSQQKTRVKEFVEKEVEILESCIAKIRKDAEPFIQRERELTALMVEIRARHAAAKTEAEKLKADIEHIQCNIDIEAAIDDLRYQALSTLNKRVDRIGSIKTVHRIQQLAYEKRMKRHDLIELEAKR